MSLNQMLRYLSSHRYVRAYSTFSYAALLCVRGKQCLLIHMYIYIRMYTYVCRGFVHSVFAMC